MDSETRGRPIRNVVQGLWSRPNMIHGRAECGRRITNCAKMTVLPPSGQRGAGGHCINASVIMVAVTSTVRMRFSTHTYSRNANVEAEALKFHQSSGQCVGKSQLGLDHRIRCCVWLLRALRIAAWHHSRKLIYNFMYVSNSGTKELKSSASSKYDKIAAYPAAWVQV